MEAPPLHFTTALSHDEDDVASTFYVGSLKVEVVYIPELQYCLASLPRPDWLSADTLYRGVNSRRPPNW